MMNQSKEITTQIYLVFLTILIEFLIIDGSESGKIYVLVNLTIFVHQRSI